MILWLDAQLPPALATWMSKHLSQDVYALRDLGLRDASDQEIFHAARAANAVVVTKDSDFLILLEQLGPPPKIIWLTLGNCSNSSLKNLFTIHWSTIAKMLNDGEMLIEIGKIK